MALVVSARRSSLGSREGRWLLGGLGLVLAASVLYRGPASFLARFSDLASTATAGDGRFVLWKDALAVAAKHPLLGTGPDSYRLGWYAVRSLASVRLSGIALTTEDPHNIVLLLMATMGIPAALYAVGLVVATLWGTGKAAFAKDAKSGQLLYSGWWAALLALAVALFFGVSTVAAAVMLFVSAAVLLAPRVTESSLTGPIRTLLVGGVAAVATVLAVLSAVTMVADVRLGQALAARDAAGIARAARIAPWHVAGAVRGRAYCRGRRAGGVHAGGSTGAGEGRARRAAHQGPDRGEPARVRLAVAARVLHGPERCSPGVVRPRRGVRRLPELQLAAEAALRLKPLGADAALLKALAESSLGDNAAAIATLEPVWDIDPRFAEAGILYLKVLEQEGDDERAEQVLATLKVGFPRNAAIQEELRSREASAPAP